MLATCTYVRSINGLEEESVDDTVETCTFLSPGASV